MSAVLGRPGHGAAWSLRGRVLLISAFALVASLVLGALAVYRAATVQDARMLDARLQLVGSTILSFVEEELNEVDAEGAMRYHNIKTRPIGSTFYSYQVWSRQGALLIRGNDVARTEPLVDLSFSGLSTVKVRQDAFRVFSLNTPDKKYVIQVAENTDQQSAQSGMTTVYYMSSLLIPFAAVFVMTWVWLRHSLGSIETIAHQLSQRSPLDLTPPRVERPPVELLPVLSSIENLLARFGRTLSAERRFTSIAAHEMRTPLAGVRAQAQIAAMARTQAELDEALDSLVAGVDRASHMLDQLLDMARIESLPKEGCPGNMDVDFAETFREVMSDLGRLAADKSISVSTDFAVAGLKAHPFALSLLIKNLVANAILYSPAGGKVEVRSFRESDAVALCIDDSGPGIAPSHRSRAFDRFDRLGQARSSGVGLGLSIVLMAAELHNGTVSLGNSPLGGLRALVLLRSLGAVA